MSLSSRPGVEVELRRNVFLLFSSRLPGARRKPCAQSCAHLCAHSCVEHSQCPPLVALPSGAHIGQTASFSVPRVFPPRTFVSCPVSPSAPLPLFEKVSKSRSTHFRKHFENELGLCSVCRRRQGGARAAAADAQGQGAAQHCAAEDAEGRRCRRGWRLHRPARSEGADAEEAEAVAGLVA
jgi:hypothetical protein